MVEVVQVVINKAETVLQHKACIVVEPVYSILPIILSYFVSLCCVGCVIAGVALEITYHTGIYYNDYITYHTSIYCIMIILPIIQV